MAVWVGSGLVDAADAKVSAFDHGLTVGDGVFETVRVEAGIPFAIGRHLARLAASAKALGLPAPDETDLRRAITAVLDATPASEVQRLRITYTGGPGPLGSKRGSEPPTLLVAIAPAGPRPGSGAVAVAPWPRNERGALAGVKSTSYAENVVALAYAQERGAQEALLADTRGRLCEGTGSNVFLVLGDRLVTPTLSTGCLAGITRALVLEWTDAAEQDVPLDAIHEADEMFLTSSIREIQPVHAVVGPEGRRELAAPGPWTDDVAARFAQHAAEDPDP